MDSKDKELYNILASFEEVDSIVEKEMSYIGVDAFKEMFKEIGDADKRPFIISKWIELAGSSVASVRIIDNEDNTLFIMPGIISPDLKSTSKSVSEVDSLYITSEEMNTNFRGSGDAIYAEHMRDIILKGKTSSDIWERVLKELLPKEDSSVVEEEEEDFDYFE